MTHILLCYCRNSLTVAKEHDIKTIAFPAISCGVYGYPIPDAAKVCNTHPCHNYYHSNDYACIGDKSTVKAFYPCQELSMKW